MTLTRQKTTVSTPTRPPRNWDRHAWTVLMTPSFVIIGLVTLIPFGIGLWTSLLNWNLADPAGKSMVWLQNYWTALSGATFWHSVGLTAYQVVGTVVPQLIIGTAIALLLARNFRGAGFVRTVYIIPMMATPVVMGLMWQMLLNAGSGTINYLLGFLGIGPIDWLGNSSLAMPTLIAVDVWMSTPLVTIIILAGLQSIDPKIYEAAAIDGAGAWKRFWLVTLPMLRPMIFLAALFRTMDAIRRFDTIYIMTGGGPGNATETLDLHAYLTAFNEYQVGLGSAIAVLMFILIAGVSVVLTRFTRTETA